MLGPRPFQDRNPEQYRRLNVSLGKPLATLAGLTLAAVVLTLVPVTPAAAQDESQEQEEALAYHAWFAANQQQDNAKAVEAAAAYIERFPNGEYAEFLSKWLAPAQLALLNEAIKAGQVDQMLKVGNQILAHDPENLNVVYALAFQLRRRELMARPRSYAHAAQTASLSQKAISLVESGKTLAGVQNFDKNATLAWLYQNLAILEGRGGASNRAVELYNKSTSLAPQDPAIAGRNLLELLSWRQASYTEAVNAYNALPEEARVAPEPSPEVLEARAKVNAESDALIDVAASFVALAEVKGLPQATHDKVYGVLEGVYKARNPDDAEGTGLQALIDAKK
jgi:tetratricopeptide (TPR) repeat protein